MILSAFASRALRLVAAAALALSLSDPVAAQSAAPSPEVQQIAALFNAPHAPAELFAASLLAQIPATAIDAAVMQMKRALGAYKSARPEGGRFIAMFANGTDSIQIRLDAAGKIEALLLGPPQIAAAGLDDAVGHLRALPGSVAYVVIEQGRERAASNADVPMSVGSAFKLAVLNALSDEIAAGRHAWNEVVPLQTAWKSLPSGFLQSWPDGSAITLQTYASLMISQSDNTAADSLARVDGPQALRPYLDGNDPLISTLEMFKLKSRAGAVLREPYRRAATPAARRAVLDTVDALPRPAIADLQLEPSLLDIDWHYSVRRLCALATRVAALPLMQINPGVAVRDEWRTVSYKGGTDAGVINATSVLTTKDGRTICFSATENDTAKAIDEIGFAGAYATVVGALK